MSDFLPVDANLRRLIVLTVVAFGVMALLSPGRFVTGANLESMAFQFPELGLLSLAMLLAMLSGGIDLSVVAVANLSGILAALVLARWMPAEASGLTMAAFVTGAALVALGCGGVCGSVNGLLISRLGISPILATLGTMQLFGGLALVVTGGAAVFGFPDAFLFLGNGRWAGVPLPCLLFLGVAISLAALVNRRGLGIYLRLLGTNPKAARFAGFRVEWVLFRSYLITGLIAGLAGILMMARTNSAKADYGTSYLLQAILVAVLGGVNPAGGFGTVLGVSVAVLALQFLASGFNMLHFSNFSKEFIWGTFLLLSMVFNYYGRQRALRATSAEASRQTNDQSPRGD